MRHVLFDESADSFLVSIFIKPKNLNKKDLLEYYVKPCTDKGMSKADFIGWDLSYTDKGTAPKKHVLGYLGHLMKAVDQVGSKYILCADGDYFKALTGQKKTTPHYGYVMPCVLNGYEHIQVVLTPNYAGTFYNPAMQQQIDLAIFALTQDVQGHESQFKESILKNVSYIRHDDPDYLDRVHDTLLALLKKPRLGIDIEGYSLNFWEAGIATIAFSEDQHTSVVIEVDVETLPFVTDQLYYHEPIKNVQAHKMLKAFFEKYRGMTIWHNGAYDVKVLTFELFMEGDFFNRAGMMKGIQILLDNFEDTKLITYLATNSCAGNKLGLKHNTHEFTGNYAMDDEDIKDIRRIPLEMLTEYNAIDACATVYLHDKYWPTVVADDQVEVYETIFKPSVKVIMQMELTGLPLNMDRVIEVDKQLCDIRDGFRAKLIQTPIVRDFWYELRELESKKAHDKWKQKTAPIEHFNYVQFNPGSDTQLRHLIYDFMGYAVFNKTKSGAGSTDADTLKALMAQAKNDDHREVFECILGIAEVANLISTFMNTFKNKSIQKSDGWYYLHGNFNLGGTVSGRLSSSQPNLQNIPNTGNRYGNLVKSCIQAPPGWLFVGADFSALEDRISALTTKDPNKLKVYTDGYDGHCLRASYYFKDQMPDIQETPDSVNSIKNKYPHLRQDSKAPTFLLTYGGTHYGLIKNLGWSETKAKEVEKAYHDMYEVSDEWVQNKIKGACDNGFVTVAFGLRVRTPILGKVVYDQDNMLYDAQAESRTAGNALGQSYGLLNNRAAIEFRERSLRSKWALHILPSAHIHDAQYFMVPNDVDCVKWVNDNLIPCMEWQELDEIKHDEVKLGGELDIFYPNWSEGVTIPNGATEDEIITICKEHK